MFWSFKAVTRSRRSWNYYKGLDIRKPEKFENDNHKSDPTTKKTKYTPGRSAKHVTKTFTFHLPNLEIDTESFSKIFS